MPSRNPNTTGRNNNNGNENTVMSDIEEDTSEKITLSFILNILDGIL